MISNFFERELCTRTVLSGEAVNIFNGVQDSLTDVANLPIQGANLIADGIDYTLGTPESQRIRVPTIPKSEWARGLIIEESGTPGAIAAGTTASVEQPSTDQPGLWQRFSTFLWSKPQPYQPNAPVIRHAPSRLAIAREL